jgi:hypothetical protein
MEGPQHLYAKRYERKHHQQKDQHNQKEFRDHEVPVVDVDIQPLPLQPCHTGQRQQCDKPASTHQHAGNHAVDYTTSQPQVSHDWPDLRSTQLPHSRLYLAEALAADIYEDGGEIRTGVEIRAILTRQDRATGLELTTGDRIEARAFVASGLNPLQTFRSSPCISRSTNLRGTQQLRIAPSWCAPLLSSSALSAFRSFRKS